MPILIPLGVGIALALWLMERKRAATVAAVSATAPAPTPQSPASALHLVGPKVSTQALAQALAQQQAAAALRALQACQAQALSAATAAQRAGANVKYTQPTTLAQCQADLAIYGPLASAFQSMSSAPAPSSDPFGGLSGSGSGSASFGFEATSGTAAMAAYGYDLATAAVLAAMRPPAFVEGTGAHGRGSGPFRGGGRGFHGGGFHGGSFFWNVPPLMPVLAAPPNDDAIRLCTWAMTGANSQTIRGLMSMYATRPDIVACLSRRLAQIEPMGF